MPRTVTRASKVKRVPYWVRDVLRDTVDLPTIKGEAGVQGPRGDIGPQGDTGPRGPKGAQGEAGPRGYTGTKGETGADGISGKDGINGKDGADGKRGKIGPMPAHEINTTKDQIRFEEKPGKWGKWIDLKRVIYGGGGGGAYISESKTINDLKDMLKDGYTGYYGDQTNDGDGNPTLIEVYSNAEKTDLLFTNAITWTSGNPTKTVITDAKTGDVLTITRVFDGSGNRTSYSEVLT